MKFISFKGGDGCPRALHAGNVNELYIRDYGESVAVKMDYFIGGHQYTASIKEFENRHEAKAYLTDIVQKLNEAVT